MDDKVLMDQEPLKKAAFVLKNIAHPPRLAISDLHSKQGRNTVSEICFTLTHLRQTCL